VENFSFNSDLANMLFGTPPDPSREVFETELVERFEVAVRSMTPRELNRHATKVDAWLLPRLSGKNLLYVAKIMESRAPAALELMPRLRARKSHAMRAAELAQILSPVALERVISALRAADVNR